MKSTSEQLQQLLQDFKKQQLPNIEQRADEDDPQACFQLGVLYANGLGVKQNSPSARKWLKRAVKGNYIAAYTILGWLYMNDESLGMSDTDAIELLLHAAEANDSDAQCSLGDIYLEGAAGIEPNPKAMLQWYSRAANLEHPKAQYMLGKFLAEGTHLPQNDEAAFRWLTLAVINQSEPAQKELAMLTARLPGDELERYKQRMLGTAPVDH